MKIVKPHLSVKKQVLTTAPFTPDGTLVDDTVALVDDTVALSGGQTTIYSSIKAKTKTLKPRSSIKIKR